MLRVNSLVGFGVRRLAVAGYGSESTAWSASLAGNATGYENYSSRVRTTGTLAAGGDQIRVRFVASTAGSFSCDNCSIGISAGANDNTTATPVELLFSGSSGFTISAAGTLVSDWVNLTTTTSDDVVVIMDKSSTNGNVRYSVSGAGVHHTSSSANSYNVVAPGYSASGLALFGFDLIEVRSAL